MRWWAAWISPGATPASAWVLSGAWMRSDASVPRASSSAAGATVSRCRSRAATARLREAEGDLDAALALLDEADRVHDGDYFILRLPVPSVLIECGFISNPAEEKLLRDAFVHRAIERQSLLLVEGLARLDQEALDLRILRVRPAARGMQQREEHAVRVLACAGPATEGDGGDRIRPALHLLEPVRHVGHFDLHRKAGLGQLIFFFPASGFDGKWLDPAFLAQGIQRTV